MGEFELEGGIQEGGREFRGREVCKEEEMGKKKREKQKDNCCKRCETNESFVRKLFKLCPRLSPNL